MMTESQKSMIQNLREFGLVYQRKVEQVLLC